MSRPDGASSSSCCERALQPFLAEVAGERERADRDDSHGTSRSGSNTLIDRQQRPARRLPEPPGRGPDRAGPRRPDRAGRGSTSTSSTTGWSGGSRELEHGAALHDRRHHAPRPRLGAAASRADQPGIAPMVRDDEIERIAVAVRDPATRRRAAGWSRASRAENRAST